MIDDSRWSVRGGGKGGGGERDSDLEFQIECKKEKKKSSLFPYCANQFVRSHKLEDYSFMSLLCFSFAGGETVRQIHTIWF